MQRSTSEIEHASRAMQTNARASAGLVLALLLGACSGSVEGIPQAPRTDLDEDGVAPGRTPSGDKPDGKSGTGDEKGNPSDPEGCGVPYAAPRAVMLTPRQYVNVLKDVIGPSAVREEDANSDDKLEFETVDLPRMTTASLDHALRLAERAAETLRGKSAQWLGCSAATDTACVRSKLSGVARKAFKRPLATDELDELMKLYELGKAAAPDSGDTGVLTAVQGILLSPSTLYRTEFTGAAAAGQRDLSAHERAAALAALLLDSTPDEPLLAAAESGALADAKGLEQQVDRLLALPRVRAHVTRVVMSAFKIPRLFETPKDSAAFPEYTPALQQSMYEESRRFIESVLWQNKPLKELLTSRTTFVDPPLAKLYGVTYPGKGNEFASVELPAERSGLLTQASLLSVLARTEKTSVVARGLFVRGNLLCLPKVSSPPMSIQAQIEEQLHDTASERDLAAYRATTSPCKSCHAGFDSFGLLLEEFDAIGRYSGEKAEPIAFNGLGGFDDPLAMPAELAKQKADDGQFASCMTRRTLGYALSVANEPLRAGCDPDALTADVIERGGTIGDLITAIARSPNFSRRAEEP